MMYEMAITGWAELTISRNTAPAKTKMSELGFRRFLPKGEQTESQ